MTAMQTTLFRSVLRALILAFPNPTLETFRDLLINGYEKYASHIATLPPDLQDFFHRDFNERNYADRRREVLQRLRLLLDNDTMRAMLTAATTRFRIGEAMDRGKIVIINNSKARLGDQGAEFFGRSLSPKFSPPRSSVRDVPPATSRRSISISTNARTSSRATRRSRPSSTSAAARTSR